MTTNEDTIYQAVVILPQSVWKDTLKRIDLLESKTKDDTLLLPKAEKFFTTEEASELLKIHPLSLGRCVKNGHIRCVKKDGRANYYSFSEIKRYMDSKPRYKI